MYSTMVERNQRIASRLGAPVFLFVDEYGKQLVEYWS